MTGERRLTIKDLAAMKSNREKITILTAYDCAMAKLVDQAGVEAILVGDSMGMVVQGHENTIPVTLDQMIYHAEIVVRASKRALIVGDMPFPTYRLGVHKAIENASRLLKEAGCQAVKLECGAEQGEVISGLVSAGIPVMAHLGLSPQAINQLGGYKVQRDENRLLNDAKTVEAAGAFAVVLECISSGIAAKITDTLSIPTIGIGAGTECDGQVLVVNDILGLTTGYVPRFVKKYADLEGTITDAVTQFRNDVRSGDFPGAEQTYK